MNAVGGNSSLLTNANVHILVCIRHLYILCTAASVFAQLKSVQLQGPGQEKTRTVGKGKIKNKRARLKRGNETEGTLLIFSLDFSDSC